MALGVGDIIAIIHISKEVAVWCHNYLSDIRHANEDTLRLKNAVNVLQELLDKIENLLTASDGISSSNNLDTLISKTKSDLEGLKQKLETKPDNHRRALFKNRMKWPFTKEEIEQTLKSLETRKNDLNLAISADTLHHGLKSQMILVNAEQRQLLEKLPSAEGAAYDSRVREHDAFCLPNTRTDILNTIKAWSGPPDSKPIFWLKGMAGTGKTTIARTVAKQLNSVSQLGASFFFRRGGGDCSHAGRFVATVALDIARLSIDHKMAICEAIARHDDIMNRSLEAQFQRLIIEPLLQVQKGSDDRGQRPTVIVIDALDECDSELDCKKILNFLSATGSFAKLNVKFLVTSRPEVPIRMEFQDMVEDVHDDFDLHDIEKFVVKEDICQVIQYEFQRVRKRHSLPTEWPGDATIDSLTEQAGTLFIYAVTVCRFIYESRSPRRAVENVMGSIPSQTISSTTALDQMYYLVLKQSFLAEHSQFRVVVGAIIVLREQLTISSLAALLSVEEDTIQESLHSLQSVIHIGTADETIQLLHPSFRDFLLDPSRCDDFNFQIQEGEANEALAIACLNLMMDKLRADLCDVKYPGTRVESVSDKRISNAITKDITYVCRDWSDHVMKSAHIGSLVEPTMSFFHRRFLFWLECLAWLKETAYAVRMVQYLRGEEEFSKNATDDNFLYDAYRFILRNQAIMEIAPLQIYHGALLFSPSRSVIRQLFFPLVKTAVLSMDPESGAWDDCLQTWEGVHTLTISHDDKLIAYATWEGRLYVRDLATGALVQRLTDPIFSERCAPLHFSPCGRFIVASYWRYHVRIYDLLNGVQTQCFDGIVCKTCPFTSDGRLLATCRNSKVNKSNKTLIYVWDVREGTNICTLEDPSDRIMGLIFSADGKFLISTGIGADGIFRIWNIETQLCLNSWVGHGDHIGPATLVVDDTMIISTDESNSIKVWNLMTGECLRVIDFTKDWSIDNVRAAHLSMACYAVTPDRKSIIHVSKRSPPRLEARDIATWNHIRYYNLDLGEVSRIMISSDGTRVATSRSVLGGGSQVFDTQSGACIARLEPDLHLLAVSSSCMVTYDQSVCKVWELMSSKSRKTAFRLEAFTPGQGSFQISKSGAVLGCESVNGTSQLWDVARGRCIVEYNTKDCWRAIGFSADQNSLVTQNRVWDLMTKLCTTIPSSEEQVFDRFRLSPDGSIVALACTGNILRIWNLRLGVWDDSTLPSMPVGMIFSEDSKLLVLALKANKQRLYRVAPSVIIGSSRSYHNWLVGTNSWPSKGVCIPLLDVGNRLNIWNLTTNQIILVDCPYSTITDMAFSRGDMLAVMSPDSKVGTINLSKGIKSRPLNISSDQIQLELPSKKRQLLATVSETSILRIWAKDTGQEVVNIDMGIGAVYGWTFFPDRELVALICENGDVRVWSMSTEKQTHHFKHNTAKCTTVRFSMTGKTLLVGLNDGTIHIWDLTLSSCTDILQGSINELQGSTISPSEELIIYVEKCNPNALVVWSIKRHVAAHRLVAPNGTIAAVTYSPLAGTVAIMDFNSTILLWNPLTGDLCNEISPIPELDSRPREILFSPNGRLLACSSLYMVSMWDVFTLQNIVHSVRPDNQIIFGIRFTTDNNLLALTGLDESTPKNVWNVSQKMSVCQILPPKTTIIDMVRESTLLLESSLGAGLSTLDPESAQKVALQNTTSFETWEPYDFQSINSHYIAAVHRKGTLHVLDENNDSYRPPIKVDGNIKNVSFSDNLQFVLIQRLPIYCIDECVINEIWDLNNGSAISVLQESTFQYHGFAPFLPYEFAFSHDSESIAFATSHWTGVWKVATGDCLWTKTLDNPVRDLYFSSDDTMVVTTNTHRVTYFWDAKSGISIWCVKMDQLWPVQVAFCPEKCLVAIVAYKNIIQVWQIPGAKLVGIFQTQLQPYRLRFSKGGLQIEVLDVEADRVFDITPDISLNTTESYWVSADADWIKWKNHDIIWIPPDYSAHNWANINDTLIIASEDRSSAFVRLCPNMDPTEWHVARP